MREGGRPAIERLLARLKQVRRNGPGWMACCPAHDDQQASLSIGLGEDGRILLHCFAGCALATVTEALGLHVADLFEKGEGKWGRRLRESHQIPSDSSATLQPPTGCTLAQYADAKRLPIPFLQSLGLRDISLGQPAVRIPYYDLHGVEVAVRFRLALAGDQRFRWKSGTRPLLYGLWRLEEGLRAGAVVLVEGESDAQTLWFSEVPALGLPGATSWQDAWADDLEGIPCLYVVIEPDAGGQTLWHRLAASRLRDRLRVITLAGMKDPSALYLADPEAFPCAWHQACEAAVSIVDHERADQHRALEDAYRHCAPLTRDPQILDRVAEAIAEQGVTGEAGTVKLLYLAVTSRLLDRPVSVIVKGPTAAGKSFLVQQVLAFFPAEAFHQLSAMSEHALAYSTEPLRHRMLVVYEAVGLKSDFASYLVRSLLSEGRIRYETVEKTKDGLRPRLIEQEGPTGLILTTTDIRLHPENESRMLSLPVTDTPEQTRQILLAQARAPRPVSNHTSWQALQTWLSGTERRVVIPYAEQVAALIPPVAVRLRRDFPTVLSLIRAQALLHQATRERDPEGQVIASLEDYAAIRTLVEPLLSDELGASVSDTVRETVETVRRLASETLPQQTEGLYGNEAPRPSVTIAAVARALRLDKSAAWRRVHTAIARGYLRNVEDRRGHPARLLLDEPLPQTIELLPPPERLEGCRVAVETEGIGSLSLAPGAERNILDLVERD